MCFERGFEWQININLKKGVGLRQKEKLLNVKEFAKACGKSPRTVTNRARIIKGHKKIKGRWYFPESSGKAFTERKAGAPRGNRNGLKSGGKSREGIRKILWVSNRDIYEMEKKAVAKLFGKTAIIIETISSNHQAEVVMNEFRRGSFDEIIVSDFNLTVCHIIKLGIKPFLSCRRKGLVEFKRVQGFEPKF